MSAKDTQKFGVDVTFELFSKDIDFTLNKIDLQILLECYILEVGNKIWDRSVSISSLKKKIDIAHKNLSPHLKKLEFYKLIIVENKGRGRAKEVTINYKDPKIIDFLDLLFLKVLNLELQGVK